MQLVCPSRDYLAGYVDALERGWSPDNLRGDVAAREQLARIVEDPEAFLARLVARDADGFVTLPDGSQVPRIPGYHSWMWDGVFVEEFTTPASLGGHREYRLSGGTMNLEFGTWNA